VGKKLPKIWPLDPHTAAKHVILKQYLGAWMAILASAHSRIVYIDACAGPGEYAGGEPGSPIVALTAAKDASARKPLTITFLFVESDKERRRISGRRSMG
jgi:three-Cys-motif partner protein